MAPRLVVLLQEELTRQRTFLSADEAAVLTRPVSFADEHDLAWERVQRRRRPLYGALRNRFIREGKPIDAWRALVAEDEAAAGGPTIISQLATQVLEWAARTSDRGAMIGGFAAKTLRWAGVVLLLLGLYGCYQGAGGRGLIFIGLALVLLLAGRIVGNLTAERAATLAQRLRSPASEISQP
jgi:hypothetical protein